MTTINYQIVISHLPNADISKWVDAVARLLDILGNGVRNELVHHLAQFRVGHVTGDDLAHLFSDSTDLQTEYIKFHYVNLLFFMEWELNEQTYRTAHNWTWTSLRRVGFG